MIEEGTLRAPDGVELRWRRAAPAGPPRGVLLVVHGYAEHVGRYAELFAHATGRGLAVAGVDLRGHGRSGGPRGHCRDFGEFVGDVRRLGEEVERWWPGRPRVLLGHSMGGLVATLYLLRHPDTVRAAALSAPALRVAADAAPWLRAVGRLVGMIAPRVPFRSNLDPTALSRDPAVGAAYTADPLVHHTASAGLVRALKPAQATALREAARLRVPLLVLHGDADRLVDPAGSRALAAALTCEHRLVVLPGYYHELLNEPLSERAKVLALLDSWFDRWLPT